MSLECEEHCYHRHPPSRVSHHVLRAQDQARIRLFQFHGTVSLGDFVHIEILHLGPLLWGRSSRDKEAQANGSGPHSSLKHTKLDMCQKTVLGAADDGAVPFQGRCWLRFCCEMGVRFKEQTWPVQSEDPKN